MFFQSIKDSLSCGFSFYISLMIWKIVSLYTLSNDTLVSLIFLCTFLVLTHLPVNQECHFIPCQFMEARLLNAKAIPLVFAFIRDFERTLRAVAFEAGIWIQENILTLTTNSLYAFHSEVKYTYEED